MNSTSNTTDAEPTGAEPERYVFIRRPQCPKCGSANLQTVRSKAQGDGTVERRTQCRSCYHRFFVVVE
ncbi:MAG: hypothetical protein NTW96_04285 [Planctomycetia bacterium]|nr:hypothetical protein [Planctomycetia bacterium]